MQNQNAFDVLVVGELNMDLILDQLNAFPELGKEKIASQLNITMGSSSAIFASNVARLGAKTSFCGLIGNDSFGNTIIDTLKQNSVDTRWITQTDKYKTGLTAIIRESDDQAMVTYPGAMTHFSPQHIPDVAFKNARHLHISSIFLQPGVKNALLDIVDKANAHGMSISIDTQWDPDENWDIKLHQLLPKIDFFLPNNAEFINMTGASSVKEGLQQLKDVAGDCSVVITCGKEGAIYLEQNNINTIAGQLNNEIVDTVGAGDSFNAGFIYRFLEGDRLEDCIKFATVTGAVSTTRSGGTKAIQSLQEVERIAKNKLKVDSLNIDTE